jgi:hypothetical protein
MKRLFQVPVLMLVWVGCWFGITAVSATDLDVVGVTVLRMLVTNLDGTGVVVLQPEAGETTATNWQVNPSVLGAPGAALTYSAAAGFTNRFPNTLGGSSGHAGGVAGIFHSVAPDAPQVDNCEANYFYSSVVALLATNFSDPIANQSFTFGPVTATSQRTIDYNYDNYASQFNTLFISAANNGGSICPPATSYNGIAVGAYGGASSVGPTIDNGRAKPDLTAPGGTTSFSTPLVTGAAAVLRQAALRGDGGNPASAADMRVIKALLLNGALKPADWTHSTASPLDTRYGAGVLNVLNAYKQLTGGQYPGDGPTLSATNEPVAATEGVYPAGWVSGWDLGTNSSTATSNGVVHYRFNLTNAASSSPFTVTATLVWNRQKRKVNINNLDLLLVNADSGTLVAGSTSLVDNVEHIYLPQLPPGRYDLQVWKRGGAFVSAAEPYALAFEFFSQPLNITSTADGTLLTWPVYPAGFTVQVATNLAPPLTWTSLTNLAPTLTDGQNCVLWPPTEGVQVFRLIRP